MRSVPRPGASHPRALAPAALAFIACCAQAGAQEAPSVTPYRPSVSTPAELSAPGYLEFELGGLSVPAPQRRDSLPYTVKLAFDEDWGVRIGGDAWVRNAPAGGPYRAGPGDTAVVLKHRIDVDEDSAYGVELGWAAPTGRSGIGAGTAAFSLNTIYSRDFGPDHLDINVGAARSDRADPGTSRVAGQWAAALSHAFDERWELAAEISGTRQQGVATTSQALFAVSYAPSRELVLDAGFARSLSGNGAHPLLFAGFTLLGPRIF